MPHGESRPDAVTPASGRTKISFASAEQREAIYRMRHAVYAVELGQHPTNAAGRLIDALDAFNHYLVATVEDRLVGFVSITPPGYQRYSIDKYLARSELPFAFDDGLFEIRILTVVHPYRGSPVAALLMYAALRWVEEYGGTRVVIIGRAEIAQLYERVGMRKLGHSVQSGALTYELMTATVAELHDRLGTFARLLTRLNSRVEWSLAIPFEPHPGTFHGGASHDALGVRPSTGRRASIITADVLDAWFPPAPAVREVLLEDVAFMAATSPSTDAIELRDAIAAQHRVDPAAIAMGAGLSDLIYRSIPRWLPSNGRVLLVEPQYAEYRHVLQHLIRCRVDVVRLDPGSGSTAIPLPDSVISGEFDLVVLVDPNNPLGYRLDPAALRHVLTVTPARTRFWIDRTYAPFEELDRSLERFAAASPNVIVGMSMSKAYALSGLRLGFLCGPPDVIADVRRASPPWAVSRPAQLAGLAAIADPDYYADQYRQTALLRGELRDGLAALPGVRPREGAANFVFCELDHPLDAVTVMEGCRARGLYVRSFPTDTELRWHALRIAVKDRPTQTRMMGILGAVIDEARRARTHSAPVT